MNNVNKQEAHNMFKENIEINSQAPSPSIQEGEDKNSGSKSSNNKEDKKQMISKNLIRTTLEQTEKTM